MDLRKAAMLSFLLAATPWNFAHATDWYSARQCMSSEMCVPKDCNNSTSPASIYEEMRAYHAHIVDKGNGRVDVVYDTVYGKDAGGETFFYSIEACKAFLAEQNQLNQDRQQELEKYR